MTQSDQSAGAPDGHIASDRIAAYLNGGLSAEERGDISAHLAECEACRGEVVEVTDTLDRIRGQRRRRWAVPAAAAATVAGGVLIGGLLLREAAENRQASEPTLRGIEGAVEREAVQPIEVLAPLDGASVEATEVSFAWRPVNGEGTLYRLTVTDEGGDPVWTAETHESTFTLAADTQLEPGRVFLWYVDALLPDGHTATTGVHRFSTAR